MHQADNYIEPVKQVVAILLVFHEQLQVLEDTFLHLDAVVVPDGVLAEKVEFNHELFAVVFLMQLNVLHSE